MKLVTYSCPSVIWRKVPAGPPKASAGIKLTGSKRLSVAEKETGLLKLMELARAATFVHLAKRLCCAEILPDELFLSAYAKRLSRPVKFNCPLVKPASSKSSVSVLYFMAFIITEQS